MPLRVTDWPQAPAGLEKMASSAGRAVGFAVRSPVGSGGAAPGYLLTNCQVRGQLEQGGLACSLLRGHPGPSPPFRFAASSRRWEGNKAVPD
ncbi:predicted protein [Streptomyces albidoflavus]|nr:predicted protein [Streptomyces albidoflavus]